jgi:hypothetical protein
VATKRTKKAVQQTRDRFLAERPKRSATVIVYSRPSGYWYAQAHDATTGALIADAAGYSRENVLRELRGKFAMIGITIKAIADEDPYADHATKKKYGKKASEKIGQTMHEFKRGKLKSGGSGKKVTSREQAIAIGISQARREGYKVPPSPLGHATMNLDARVRAYLSNMRPGAEIDARGIARALRGGVDPLEADYALERAQKAGLAVTEDGKWFGPAVGRVGKVAHARKKTPAQLDREIADALAKKPADQWTVHDRLAVMTPSQKKRELKDLQQARERYFRSLGYAGNTPDQVRKYHDAIAEIEAKMKLFK